MTHGDPAIIQLFHVYKRYGSKNALFDITLSIHKNTFLFISGPSGAGKSTLLKILYLGEGISEGQVLVDGMNLARISSGRAPLLRRKLGIIFQDFKLIATKTVYENVSLVLESRGLAPRFIKKKVNSVLRTVGMADRYKSFPPSLSGGEQQKVAVARAIAGDPKIILADEPTGSLDAESAATVVQLIKQFHQRGATVLFATHDKTLIQKASEKVIWLSQGRMVS